MQVNYYRFNMRGAGREEQLRMWDDSISPLKEVAKVNVPMLIVHGSVDQRVPPDHAKKYLKLLDEHDKTYKYVELDGADHFSNTTVLRPPDAVLHRDDGIPGQRLRDPMACNDLLQRHRVGDLNAVAYEEHHAGAVAIFRGPLCENVRQRTVAAGFISRRANGAPSVLEGHEWLHLSEVCRRLGVGA